MFAIKCNGVVNGFNTIYGRCDVECGFVGNNSGQRIDTVICRRGYVECNLCHRATNDVHRASVVADNTYLTPEALEVMLTMPELLVTLTPNTLFVTVADVPLRAIVTVLPKVWLFNT